MWGVIAIFEETGECFAIKDFEGRENCITFGDPKMMTKAEAERVLDLYENHSIFKAEYRFELVEEGSPSWPWKK